MSQLLKIEAPHLSLSGFSPATQLGTFPYISNHRSWGATIGTHIKRGISLLMPLRFVRQAVANRRRSRLYCSSSSALIGSPPCGSCSVYKLAHTVYKYASNKCTLKNVRSTSSRTAVFISSANRHISFISTI